MPELDSIGASLRRRYTTSKLANIYFAYGLHQKIQQRSVDLPASVTVNAFDPGLMPGTGLARDYPPMARFLWSYVLPVIRPVLRRAMVDGNVHSADVSGLALANLIVASEFAGVSGLYFEGQRPVASSVESYEEVRWSELWRGSEQLVAESMNAAAQR